MKGWKMTQGQYYPGQVLDEAPIIYDNLVTARGMKASGAAPTVAAGAGAGSTGAVSQQVGYDMAGSFVVTPSGNSILAGTLATVTFGTPLSAVPSAVLVSAADETLFNGLAAGAGKITGNGFSVETATAGSASTIRVSYAVIR